MLTGGKNAFMELARLAPEVDPECTKVIEAWDSQNSGGKKKLSLDLLCKTMNVDPIHFLSVVNEAALKYRDNASIFLAAVNMPKIMARSVKEALKSGGTRDREMLFKHAGILPVPAGATFVNTLNTKVETNVESPGQSTLPSFEKSMDLIDVD
jgi:hypothetical protein